MLSDELGEIIVREPKSTSIPPPPRTLKTTISLTPEAAEVLRELAANRNVSFAEVIRRALHVEKLLQDAQRGGGKLMLEEPERPARELVIL